MMMMMKFQHLFIVVLLATIAVSPAHATICLFKWISGPCGRVNDISRFSSLFSSCECTRKGIYGYEGSCTGKITRDNDDNTTSTFYTDMETSGKNFGGAETIYREYSDKEKKTETYLSIVKFKSQGLIRRLFFGPFYQDATCTKVTREGVPCQSFGLSAAYMSWPDAFCACSDD